MVNSKTLSVSVIIPNYNGEGLLRENLPEIIRAADNPGNNIREIIVVDDGSVDGSVDLIKKEFSSVKLIKHIKNRGFPSAVNTGVKSSKGDLVALINSDVVPGENFLEKVVPYFNDGKVFAVSLHEKGYGYAKGYFESGFLVHRPGEESGKKHLTFWVSGGSGVFRRSLWYKLGGFDEKLFSPYYWEDVDLGYRALKAGYKLYWEPDSYVVHNHETTMSKIPKRKRSLIQERNQLLFVWKNITSQKMIRHHVLGLSSRILRHPGYIRVFLSAFIKLPTVIKARQKVRKSHRLSDEAVLDRYK